MELNELKNKITQADKDAISIVDALSDKEGAVSVIRTFLTDKDPEVRSVAVECLSIIPHPASIKLLADMLCDSLKSIRTTALQTLFSRYDKSILPEMISNTKNPDPDIASGVALIIGFIADKSAIPELKKQIKVEMREEVKRNQLLALGRLGDIDAQRKIVEPLKIPDSKRRMQIIEDIRYVNDQRIAPYLFYAMDDYGKGYNIGSKNEPKYARVLDAAITLAAKLMDNPFSFSIKEYDLYTSEEIIEARTKLEPMTK